MLPITNEKDAGNIDYTSAMYTNYIYKVLYTVFVLS